MISKTSLTNIYFMASALSLLLLIRKQEFCTFAAAVANVNANMQTSLTPHMRTTHNIIYCSD